MGKLKILKFFCFFAILFTPLACFAQEQITLTTYYPSPYGTYFELHADRMAIGSTYRAVTPANDGDLLVQNRVGIGIQVPAQPLEIGNATEGHAFGVSASGDILVTGGSDNIWALYKNGTGKISINAAGDIGLADDTNVTGNITASGNATATRLGAGVLNPTATLDVRGNSNTCIQMAYSSPSSYTITQCPAPMYITLASFNPIPTPALPSGYFMCCRTCGPTDTDGVC